MWRFFSVYHQPLELSLGIAGALFFVLFALRALRISRYFLCGLYIVLAILVLGIAINLWLRG